MKYCRKCGMLLEDSTDNCIRCGEDVSKSENVSMFPIEVLETIGEQKEQQKKRTKLIILIIGIFVALVALIGFAAEAINSGMLELPGSEPTDESMLLDESYGEESLEEDFEEEMVSDEVSEPEQVEEPEAEAVAEMPEEPSPTPEPEPIESEREIQDDFGTYYNYSEEYDDAENHLFTAVVPEDFVELEFSADYGKYSNRFPLYFQYAGGLEDYSVIFRYSSPQHLWYKKSETLGTLKDFADSTFIMTFAQYDGPKAYVENMLKQSFPDAKKINLIEEIDLSEATTEAVKKLSDSRKKALFGDIGDYCNIGEGTTYANMDAEYCAYTYKYEVTTKEKEVTTEYFYVPMIANNLTYANNTYNDRGTVTEWFILGLAVMEAGSDDLYEQYLPDFEVFLANCVPTNEFFYINEKRSDEINKAVASEQKVEVFTLEKRQEYKSMYNSSKSIDPFYAMVRDSFAAYGAKKFEAPDAILYTNDEMAVAFVDKESSRAYISDTEDEYPGDEYEELKSVHNSSPAADNDEE